MLRHLRVTNFAILSDVSLELGPGMNVLTGETGAGKSLIVEAVNLLRGGRASADIPRTGTDQAVVEAIFEDPSPRVLEILAEAGLPETPGELLVRRVISRGGRSRTYVNGALTTASRLAEIGQYLVDLSGQHQHQGLVDPRRHRDILDAFAGAPELVAKMRGAWDQLSALRAQLAELSGDERARHERIDYLAFQLRELDDAGLEPGEDGEIRSERDRLAASSKLEAAARAAEVALSSGEPSASDLIGAAARELEPLAAIDAELSALLDQIAGAQASVDSAALDLQSYADSIDGDPQRLAELDDRLAEIKRLLRKHGPTVEDLLERHRELQDELDQLQNAGDRSAQLEVELDELEGMALAIAAELREARHQAARTLEREVGGYLRELDMSGADLRVAMAEGELGPHGFDRPEFTLAANKGEKSKPLTKVASGGELSRIMLAMKLALRRADDVGTYVFDEVDTGIGGTTADAVGAQIGAVAGIAQVLCVTHLPQIAAYADAHFHVSKAEIDGRVETEVHRLEGGERRDELARMLGGKLGRAKLSKHARAHADELIAAAARSNKPASKRRTARTG